MELKELIAEYMELGSKYALPSFKELNENFEIDKIDRESETLLRIIRKTMMDKIVNSLGFLDLLLNSMNAPRFYHGFLRSMTQEDKALIDKLYGDLGQLSTELLPLEIEYSEKAEADSINKIYSVWKNSRASFLDLVKKVGRPVVEISKKEKSYFG